MKYLSIFASNAAYDAAKSEGLDLPHVSLIADTMDVMFDPYVPVTVNEPADNQGGNSEENGNEEFNPEDPSEPTV